jgi:hypothetical protein
LQAITALLTGAYRLSKRQVESLLADVVGVPLCAGQVCAMEQQTSAALTPAVAELQQNYVGTTSTWMRRVGGRASDGPGSGSVLQRT